MVLNPLSITKAPRVSFFQSDIAMFDFISLCLLFVTYFLFQARQVFLGHIKYTHPLRGALLFIYHNNLRQKHVCGNCLLLPIEDISVRTFLRQRIVKLTFALCDPYTHTHRITA